MFEKKGMEWSFFEVSNIIDNGFDKMIRNIHKVLHAALSRRKLSFIIFPGLAVDQRSNCWTGLGRFIGTVAKKNLLD